MKHKRRKPVSHKRRLTRVEGYVWCDKHGTIHDDVLDPYEYGAGELCDPKDHVAVYARQGE